MMNRRDKAQQGSGRAFTSGNLSRTSLIFSPFWPMIVRWNFCSTIRSLVRSFSWKWGEKKCERATLESVYRTSLGYPILTILWTISMSSLRASWTPFGSPSIRTRPLRSESWGIRTNTLYCSLIRLTVVRMKKSREGMDDVTEQWENEVEFSKMFSFEDQNTNPL